MFLWGARQPSLPVITALSPFLSFSPLTWCHEKTDPGRVGRRGPDRGREEGIGVAYDLLEHRDPRSLHRDRSRHLRSCRVRHSAVWSFELRHDSLHSPPGGSDLAVGRVGGYLER